MSIVFVWFAGMHFHCAYFSNYTSWLKDPCHIVPSAHVVWEIVGQGILNSEVGGYLCRIHITSGMFSILRSEGIVSVTNLKFVIIVALIRSTTTFIGAYIHMHVVWYNPRLLYKYKSIYTHHLIIL